MVFSSGNMNRFGARNGIHQGCWACRTRKKKCSLDPLNLGSCDECKRLGIKCYGFGAKLTMVAYCACMPSLPIVRNPCCGMTLMGGRSEL
ncbi:uncharacterized protein EI90DRAFT_3054794 [Cantharellus anzutake]|uniref:uncharacterized protein n=1 Tax=Cantharellus anzutake TaxID=1750568 RepID=UPI0019037C9A|nr:uncharacterized protein EI90DRAFT_3054794 [Cantharellus anzutake]KAF8332257.1 hypothetical protein EI90DRAFT_3054794 [Cantharellus anzutake]